MDDVPTWWPRRNIVTIVCQLCGNDYDGSSPRRKYCAACKMMLKGGRVKRDQTFMSTSSYRMLCKICKEVTKETINVSKIDHERFPFLPMTKVGCHHECFNNLVLRERTNDRTGSTSEVSGQNLETVPSLQDQN